MMYTFRIIGKIAVFLFTMITMMTPVAVWADSVEGTIRQINEAENLLRLSDGHTYTLPGEFDSTILNEGMKVLVFYDIAGENRYISDIEPEGVELPQLEEMELPQLEEMELPQGRPE